METVFTALGANIITVLLSMSLLAAIVTALFSDTASGEKIKSSAFIMASAIFIASLYIYFNFDANSPALQFAVKYKWISSLNINYGVGIDGLSLFLVLLTTLLTPIVIVTIDTGAFKNLKYYIALYFLLEFTMLGALVATDMVLFYAFWELMLIPMYLIIGCWGGPNRIHAAVKFFLYTVFGSVFMLWAIFWVVSYHQSVNGSASFDIYELSKLVFDPVSQRVLFCFFSIAFMIKVPLFPFHTWLAHAHVEAPTGGSVILAAVLLKMGTYGFLRFSIPMFPQAAAEFAPYMMFLGAFGVFYGAIMSYAQTDLKKLIAYSSVSHLGAVTAGIFVLNAQGISGSVIQMINHGISTGALFLLVGVIYERRHSRELSEFGGLAGCMPLYSTLFAVATFSSIGLPGLNGFIGEFLILLGAFGSSWTLGFLSATGVILGAVYMLMVYERMFLGKITKTENERLADLNFSEKLGLAPLIILMFAIGIYPSFITNKIEKAVVAVSAPFAKKITAEAGSELSRYLCKKNY